MYEYSITAPYLRVRLLLSGVVLTLIYMILAEFKLLHIKIGEITKIEDFWYEITRKQRF